ncbi:uncharacterized protein EDB91DRAFT_1079939 [Suillus paluster]|uniref:uncharacterized protein n=1 Tax=Suillus paluster TaxID=48578 RepID=UPI001B87C8D1|nr:uncharacterized protein EDB91DRAFT_1079939 [Suillus paluster]KAG1746616.1 hypothetical protein EDB91DRAFT_1079939 [Suillus paluster]
MTLVSDDPSWWPIINSYDISSYFAVAASAGVIYDWALTFGQEVELIWGQRWSRMTAFYLGALSWNNKCCRHTAGVPTIPVTDAGCYISYVVLDWISVVVNIILGVIMIIRLHAMSQKSSKMLILLVVLFLAANTFDGVVAALFVRKTSGEVLILSGTYQCTVNYEVDALFLDSLAWILAIVWEVLALCLAVWIVVKHFRELRRHSVGEIAGDCFMMLIKTHMVYFGSSARGSFVIVSCSNLVYIFSPISEDTSSLETQVYSGVFQIFMFVQMFVLGPRLILSVREYYAKLVAGSYSGAGTPVVSIAFQERVHVSTSSSV